MTPGLHAAIAANDSAVSAFVDAARVVSAAQWAVPRSAGKWSAGQVTEHVALTYEQSQRMLQGTFTGPSEPWFKQLLARWLFLRLMFRRNDFGGPSVAPNFIQPGESPVSSGELVRRLTGAVADLEANLAAASTAGRTHLDHPIFGRLPLTDLMRFLMIHTQHHRPQLAATS
jgi:hypothetical protein